MEAIAKDRPSTDAGPTSPQGKTMNALRAEMQALGDKINELEMDQDEHQQVIAALEPLPPTRRCWRRIGGVLVESDVAGILPALRTTLEGIDRTIVNLREALRTKGQEVNAVERELGHPR